MLFWGWSLYQPTQIAVVCWRPGSAEVNLLMTQLDPFPWKAPVMESENSNRYVIIKNHSKESEEMVSFFSVNGSWLTPLCIDLLAPRLEIRHWLAQVTYESLVLRFIFFVHDVTLWSLERNSKSPLLEPIHEFFGIAFWKFRVSVNNN